MEDVEKIIVPLPTKWPFPQISNEHILLYTVLKLFAENITRFKNIFIVQKVNMFYNFNPTNGWGHWKSEKMFVADIFQIRVDLEFVSMFKNVML